MDNINHSGHRQRMKDQFLSEGIDSFNDYQVLEMLLFYGIPHKDTNSLAHKLLDIYGSLSGVLGADFYELAGTPGIGKHAATLIKLTPALTRRYMRDRWKGRVQITDVKKAGSYAASLFIGDEYEAFYMICMNSQNYIIKHVLISEGTINEAMIYPRVVVENALRHKASGVILTHNHPGGSTEPSLADIEITKRLTKALEVISVKIVDHIVVSGEKYISMTEKRLI